ncbi:hypothetical protein AC244_05795 [Ensifer adhaerens]|uniref:Uncharacterized protein n=1 Tax=Ensifer adhaerens TaxID=106592 RepID=A0A0L8C224_ENSAD|nr:hypothetical protein [Ensifer adhaerens]KOF20930.1 hypothetical protein AC244_05795 [Ensifer adhaerens]
MRTKGPAVGEYPVDPTFHDGRHRPPIDREGENQDIGALDPQLLATHILRNRFLVAIKRQIILRHPRVESLAKQIGSFDGGRGMTLHAREVALRQGCHEGPAARIGCYDENVHD